MRFRIGTGIALLSGLVALLGVAIMIVLGPDGQFKTGRHSIETDGIAIVTQPKVVSWSGLDISVLAELPANKPVFVGLGNTVDVRAYLGKTARMEVDNFQRPWKLQTRNVDGKKNLAASPTALDWWIDKSAGLGGASISTVLPDETVSLAILSVGDSNLNGLKVTVAYGVAGGFAKGISLLLIGLAGVVIGVKTQRGTAFWRGGGRLQEAEADIENDDSAEPQEIEETVYYYIDDDGVEQVVSADDLAEYEVIDDDDDASDKADSPDKADPSDKEGREQ